jgi:hypothetical protein
VAPVVLEEFRVFVALQGLAYHLDGEHLRVEERLGGSACSQAPEVFDSVVYEAEDGDDESAKIREMTSPTALVLLG